MLGMNCLNDRCGLVFDIDGVLVNNEKINPALSLIKYADKSKWLISICSGRGKNRTLNVTQNIIDNEEAIFCINGGASFMLGEKIICENVMNKKEIHKAVESLKSIIDANIFFVNVCIAGKEGYVYYSDSENNLELINESKYEAMQIFNKFDEFAKFIIEESIVKVTVKFKGIISTAIERNLESAGFICGDSKAQCYYCISNSLNKNTAINFLVHRYNLKKVYFFGNDKNDIPIFKNSSSKIIKIYVIDGEIDEILYKIADERIMYGEMYYFIRNIMEIKDEDIIM